MTAITEDYVSFETAKLLKEKGFDEPVTELNKMLFKEGEKPVLKITLQKAMKWLREVYKLYVEVYIVKNYSNKTIEYCITIEDLNFPGNKDGFHIIPSQESYEEACKVAIKYCLEHLI